MNRNVKKSDAVTSAWPPLLVKDHVRLSRQAKNGKGVEEALALAAERYQQRWESCPVISYAEGLPVAERAEDIVRAITEHQVLIVSGDTGSGKSTQLPKMALAAGCGRRGFIGHTQPRRLAARTLAGRVAEELGQKVGQSVGFKVRFSDQTSNDTLIKLMTDGMLLSEVQQDRWLNAYDCLIIDEAHERSLNIDFLLGYLRQLLSRRPDLKLIITSATIDTERFAKHFDHAPVIKVAGRSYPVEMRYRPWQERGIELNDAIAEALDELEQSKPNGDVLVFLPGEREIREAQEALGKHFSRTRAGRPQPALLPLYARLSAAQQAQVFKQGGGRRIILATNVAETSLTVPGIVGVVDVGLARISRYSARAKIQRLPIEPVSQAAANQRAGRCGRVAPGICIRLYAEDDFQQRDHFTQPEIQRTNLASVILQMGSLRLGKPDRFPFMQPPEARYINDGYRLLAELGAVDEQRQLTEVGKTLSRLPLDPRLGRMVLAAAASDCLSEVVSIAAMLASQDPRERPADQRGNADAKHELWRVPGSDFMTVVQLRAHLRTQREQMSQGQLRRHCQKHFLNWMKVREWLDIERQLLSQCQALDLGINEQPAEADSVHQALVHGLLSHVGLKTDKGDYLGARNLRFRIFPGSVVAGAPSKTPKWLMAAEITETSGVYARMVAPVQPAWLERAGSHLLSIGHANPHWSRKAGRAMLHEQATLYGLPIYQQRAVNCSKVDVPLAHELFIRHALVAGQANLQADFLSHNQQLLDKVERLEAKVRRRDILVDEQVLFDFYASRVDSHLTQVDQFRSWLRKAEVERREALKLSMADLVREQASTVDDEQFPDHVAVNGLALPLDYQFEPGKQDDGVAVTVPIGLLPQLNEQNLEWSVPGLLEEQVTALLRALPKPIRRQLVPIPDYARACVQRLQQQPPQASLRSALMEQLARHAGVEVPADAWASVALADHLRARIKVVDGDGQLLAEGRDLQALQEQLATHAQVTLQEIDSPWQRDGLSDWDLPEQLPEQVELKQPGLSFQVLAYPALVDQGDSAALQLLDQPRLATALHARGVQRLLMLAARQQARYVQRNLPDIAQIQLAFKHAPKPSDIFADPAAFQQYEQRPVANMVNDIVWASFADAAGLDTVLAPRQQQQFERCLEAGRADWVSAANQRCALLLKIGKVYAPLRTALQKPQDLRLLEANQDIRQQLDELIFVGFAARYSLKRLAQLPRYLQAISRRLEKLPERPQRDREWQAEIKPFWQQYQNRRRQLDWQSEVELDNFRWALEELRVSLFAQDLKTAHPVSAKRLKQQWQGIVSGATK